MAEHQLEVNIEAKLGKSIDEINKLKKSFEDLLGQVNLVKDALGDLNSSINDDLKKLISNLADFKGGTITVQTSGTSSGEGRLSSGEPSYGGGGQLEGVTAKISSIAWESGHPDDSDALDGIIGHISKIDDKISKDTDRIISVTGHIDKLSPSNFVLKDVSAKISELGFARDSSRTLHRVAARVSSAKWEDGASKTLRSTIAHITDLTQGQNAKSINLTAVIDSVKWMVPFGIPGDNKTGRIYDPNANVNWYRDLYGDGFAGLYASGKSVATVAEGGVDEVVVNSDWLRKNGPVGLDKAVASVVKATPGGVDVAIDDFPNTSIIPLDYRYPQFKAEIFGNKFADGKIDYVGAFEDGLKSTFNVDSYVDPTETILILRDIMGRLDKDASQRDSAGYASTWSVIQLSEALKSRMDSMSLTLDNLASKSDDLISVSSEEVVAVKDVNKLMSDLLGDVTESFYSIITSNGPKSGDEKALESLKQAQDSIKDHLQKIEDKLVVLQTASQTNNAPGSTSTSSATVTPPAPLPYDPESRTMLQKIYDAVTTGDWAAKRAGLNYNPYEGKTASEVDDARGKSAALAGYNLTSGFISGAMNAGSNIVETLLKRTLGAIEDIYGKLKEASPLLQTVETLFNLAMRLFFMPLGNKLAEILIPSTVELVEKVTDLWDMFDEADSLGELFTMAIDYGVELFADYFSEIGEELAEQGGLIGSVGELIIKVANFLEHNGAGLLNFLMGVMGTVIDHFKDLVSLLVAFKVMSYTQSMLQIEATIAAGMIASAPMGTGTFIGGVILAALSALIPLAVGSAAGDAVYGALSLAGLSEGGYVPATGGGQVVRVAEGGEGEYVIPESLMPSVISGGEPALRLMMEGSSASTVYGSSDVYSSESFHYSNASSNSTKIDNNSLIGGNTVINYYINGYTDSELKHIITDTVNEIVIDSRVKGRYW